VTEPDSRPRILVILRLGSDHRVSGWAKVPEGERSWDLLLSPYDEICDLYDFAPTWIVPRHGGKWDAVFSLLTEQPELLERYDFFWLPDDDIEMEAGGPDAFFRYALAAGLDLAQPALLHGSNYSHFVTLRNRFTRLRHTNFVELMAPLMTTEVLRQALPLMEGQWTGKGIDYIWQRFARDGDRRIGIVDATPMGHFRKTGRHLQSRMLEAGVEEARPACRSNGRDSSRYCPLTLSAGAPGGRGLATAVTLLNLLLSPCLWRRSHASKILTHLGGQLLLSDWQGSRGSVHHQVRNGCYDG
jgi:Protein of unknown function (DUF707)